MKTAVTPGTWGYHATRPCMLHRDLSNVMLPEAVKRLNEYMSLVTDTNAKPESEALTFYLMNHVFGSIRMKFESDEPLGEVDKLAHAYCERMGTLSTRAFYYLLLICTREARHVHQNSCQEAVKAKYGPTIRDFIDSIKSAGSSGAASRLKDHPPSVPMGKYTEALWYTFQHGSFNGGYGGKAWAKVTHCLNEFVWGRYSAEMMMDTVWTLAHNNGPIFNKGMLYGHYDGALKQILDVQRSGQIPNLFHDRVNHHDYLSSQLFPQEAIEFFCKTAKHFPDLDTPIDWPTVEKLGALGHYGHFISQQEQYYGKSKIKEPVGVMHGFPKAPPVYEQWAESTEPPVNEKFFFITPTEKMKVLTRQELKELQKEGLG